MIKKVTLKVFLVVLGILFGLLPIELYLHLFQDENIELHRDDRPPFFYRAGQRSKDGINHDFDVSKPESTYRIAVVGDSFTKPHRIQFDDAYPARLERMIKVLKNNDAPNVEVLNLGVSGSSTNHERYLVRNALRLQSDLIVLQVTLNDPEMSSFVHTAQRHPHEYVFGSLDINQDNHPVLYYCKICGFVARRLHNRATIDSYIRYHNHLFLKDENWKHFERPLLRIYQLTREANVPLLVVVVPMLQFEINSHYPFYEVHEKIDALLEAHKIPYVDLFYAFSHLDPQRLQLVPGEDGHPGELAHRIISEHVYIWLHLYDMLPEFVQKRAADSYREEGRHKQKGFVELIRSKLPGAKHRFKRHALNVIKNHRWHRHHSIEVSSIKKSNRELNKKKI